MFLVSDKTQAQPVCTPSIDQLELALELNNPIMFDWISWRDKQLLFGVQLRFAQCIKLRMVPVKRNQNSKESGKYFQYYNAGFMSGPYWS